MPARRRAAFTVALPPALTGVTATAAVSAPDDPTGPPDLTAPAEADGDAWTGTFRPDRSGDWVSMRLHMEDALSPEAMRVLAQAEISSAHFEDFFHGFARADASVKLR